MAYRSQVVFLIYECSMTTLLDDVVARIQKSVESAKLTVFHKNLHVRYR